MNDHNKKVTESIGGMELNHDVITSVQTTLRKRLPALMTNDLNRVIMFGSCARGDYDDDSDIDVALIMNCGRDESKQYQDALADLSATIAMDNYAVVNFCCIPKKEFESKKKWYLFFHNIAAEGITIYG